MEKIENTEIEPMREYKTKPYTRKAIKDYWDRKRKDETEEGREFMNKIKKDRPDYYKKNKEQIRARAKIYYQENKKKLKKKREEKKKLNNNND